VDQAAVNGSVTNYLFLFSIINLHSHFIVCLSLTFLSDVFLLCRTVFIILDCFPFVDVLNYMYILL
jgi:hypothetical protein